MNIISRPWEPQDLLDDLQMYIDEEPNNYLNGRRTTMCMARDFLKEHFREDTKMMEWISVEERLPDTYKNVLCCKDRDIRIGYYLGATYSKSVAAFRDLRSAFAFGATHWMPLPEPPKED